MHVKLLTTLLLIILLSGVFLTLDTNASYSDRENANGNSLTAATLDMSMRDAGGTTITSLFDMTGAKPGDSQEKTLVIANDGALDFVYRLRVEGISGTTALCDAITLDVKNGATPVYSGPMSGFTGDPTTYSAGSNTWTLTAHFNKDDAALMHTSCAFTLRANAWQAGTSGLWGFSDTESVTNSIQTNTWVVVSFTKRDDNHTVSFNVTNIEDYTLVTYKITYASDGGDKGIQGTQALSGDHSYEKTDQFLGSCTSGGTCTPDTGVANLKLTIELTDSGGTIHTFEKTL